MRWSSVCTALWALAASVSAIDPVSVKGNKFFNKDGSQFFMKGVAYQLSPEDPLIDTEQCKRDIKLMEELGVNSIRIYHVDPDADHDGCMNAFADAGIYLLIDLDTFDTYIVPENLFWNETQYDAYAKVMDTFQGYDNTLGFFVGNEVVYKKTDSRAAPFIKAAARDMKAYRDSKGYRKIPVGYSAADIKQLRPMLQDYLTCGGNSSEIIDFFGLNSYSWCGDSSYELSTYDQLEEQAKDFPVPIFFTETGCIKPSPRLWQDQDAIFGDKMIHDWSGAIVYEWIQEENNYGLITYGNGETVDPVRSGTPTPMSPDFDNLKTKWATIHPTGTSLADYEADNISTRPCPTSTADGWWSVNGNVQMPTLGDTMAPEATYTTQADATADPSDSDSSDSKDPSATSKAGKDGEGGEDGEDGDGESAASLDKKITVVGASIAGVVLGCCLLL